MKTILSVVIICSLATMLASCDTGPFVGLTAISVAPVESFIAINATQQFKAIGTYSDNSTSDEQSFVTWSSSNTAIASISSSGLATGIAVGITTITASWTDAGGKVYSGTSTLNVINSTLVSIEVSPASPSSAIDTGIQFTATGTYADNSTIDMTKAVLWSSSSTTVASISNTPSSIGKATALAVGITMIAATDIATNISGTTTLTVTH